MIDITELPEEQFNQVIQGINEQVKAINDYILPDEMVVEAVKSSCDFFGLPEVPVVNSDGSCVWPNDSSTVDDDVFGFNRQELMTLGIKGYDSLTMVYTHECAHRALQQVAAELDPWEHELACDYFAGIHAALRGLNTDNFETALCCTKGSNSHPAGVLREEFIEYGKEVVEEMKARNIKPSFSNCLERFNQHLIDRSDFIEECREQVISLNPIIGGKPSHLSDQENAEWAEWHTRQAAAAVERGDYSSAQDHTNAANSYNAKIGKLIDGDAMHITDSDVRNAEWAQWHTKMAKAAAERGDYSSARDHEKTAASYNAKIGKLIDGDAMHITDSDVRNAEWAQWHTKMAKAAAERGDYSSARDHEKTAASYNSKIGK